MKQEIINFLDNMNIVYVALSILILIVSLLFLSKKKVNNTLREIYIILYVTLAWVGFYFFNDILNSIFDFKFLSVKLYLILLIIGNIIMLININFNIRKVYKIINYMLFTTNLLIFITNIVIIIGNKYNIFVIASLEDVTTLTDINFIIFISYLIIMCIMYIFLDVLAIVQEKIKILKYDLKEKKEKTKKQKELSPVIPKESLSNQNVVYYKKDGQDGFFIDGIDCSIIFEDDNKDNIIKNYYILLNDVNAKLINGYTLNEYKKIKNIINKLNIKDLNNIELDVNKLSKITIDEYNLLKRYLSSRKEDYNKN